MIGDSTRVGSLVTMPDSRRGRSRSEASRRAILDATRHELAEHGYDRLSIDRIAAAAGAGKQTVYRWYPSKRALVADCLLDSEALGGASPVPDTGDLRRDLREWLRVFFAFAGGPGTAAFVRAATAAAAESDEIAVRFYEQHTSATEAALTARLRQAGAAGREPSRLPVGAAAQALVGAVLYRLLTRQPLTDAFAEELVELLCGGPPAQAVAEK